MKKFQWINTFIRDILLISVVSYIDWITNYNTWICPFMMGSLLVLMSWKISDLYNQIKEERCHS